MAARAFAPEEYARSAASGAAWDQAGLDAARSAGLLEGQDAAALTGAVTRQDAALLLCNALPEEYTPSFWDQPIDPTALSDWGRMDSLRQEAVAELARRCVIQGKADGSFGYADPLQRCDGAGLLMRVLEQVDDSCRGESQTVTLHILNADTGEALPARPAGGDGGEYLPVQPGERAGRGLLRLRLRPGDGIVYQHCLRQLYPVFPAHDRGRDSGGAVLGEGGAGRGRL